MARTVNVAASNGDGLAENMQPPDRLRLAARTIVLRQPFRDLSPRRLGPNKDMQLGPYSRIIIKQRRSDTHAAQIALYRGRSDRTSNWRTGPSQRSVDQRVFSWSVALPAWFDGGILRVAHHVRATKRSIVPRWQVERFKPDQTAAHAP